MTGFGPNGELPPEVVEHLRNLPLAHYVAMVLGINLTVGQVACIDAWLERHNRKLHDRAVANERARSAAVACRISLN